MVSSSDSQFVLEYMGRTELLMTITAHTSGIGSDEDATLRTQHARVTCAEDT